MTLQCSMLSDQVLYSNILTKSLELSDIYNVQLARSYYNASRLSKHYKMADELMLSRPINTLQSSSVSIPLHAFPEGVAEVRGDSNGRHFLILSLSAGRSNHTVKSLRCSCFYYVPIHDAPLFRLDHYEN